MAVDLLYAKSTSIPNSPCEEVGILRYYSMDVEMGDTNGHNSFEIKTHIDNDKLSIGDFVFVENEEYGGIIDYCKVDTKTSTIYYGGRTWRGIMESECVPNDIVISEQIDVVELTYYLLSSASLGSGIWDVNHTPLGVNVRKQTLKANTVYGMLMDVYKRYRVKMHLRFNPSTQRVSVTVENSYDITSDFEITSDLFDMTIKKDFSGINHLKCMSDSDSFVFADLYVKQDGTISTNQQDQYFKLMNEIQGVFTDSSETVADLISNGIEYLRGVINVNEIKIILKNDMDVDIGDRFTVTEEHTNTTVTQYISRKVATITEDDIVIQYDARQ